MKRLHESLPPAMGSGTPVIHGAAGGDAAGENAGAVAGPLPANAARNSVMATSVDRIWHIEPSNTSRLPAISFAKASTSTNLAGQITWAAPTSVLTATADKRPSKLINFGSMAGMTERS